MIVSIANCYLMPITISPNNVSFIIYTNKYEADAKQRYLIANSATASYFSALFILFPLFYFTILSYPQPFNGFQDLPP